MPTQIIPAKTWTQITTGNATAISFQNQSRISQSHPDLTLGIVKLKGTVDATQPTDDDGAIEFSPGQALTTKYALADLWPSGSFVRVWAWCETKTKVFADHA